MCQLFSLSKKLKNTVLFVLYSSVAFCFFACGEDEYDKTCKYAVENGNSSVLHLGRLAPLDFFIAPFWRYSFVGYYNDIPLEKLIELKEYFDRGTIFVGDPQPITFSIDVNKKDIAKNDFVEHKYADTVFNSILANVWFVDEFCNQTQHSRIPLFLFEENESTFVFMSRIRLENGDIVGNQIFLSTLTAFEKIEYSSITYSEHGIIIIPVIDDLVNGYIRMEISVQNYAMADTFECKVKRTGNNQFQIIYREGDVL